MHKTGYFQILFSLIDWKLSAQNTGTSELSPCYSEQDHSKYLRNASSYLFVLKKIKTMLMNGHIVQIVRKKKTVSKNAHLKFSVAYRIPTHNTVLPTFRLCLLKSIKSINII